MTKKKSLLGQIPDFKKSRKYPIQRDKFGRSHRQRVLMLFDLGLRPAEVTRILSLRATTTFRYFQQWKRLPPLFMAKYRFTKTLFRRIGADGRRIIATVLAAELGTSEKEVLAQMRKPWGTRQIITGDWRYWPVRRTGVRQPAKLRAWLSLHLSSGSTEEVRHVIKMALNPRLHLHSEE